MFSPFNRRRNQKAKGSRRTNWDRLRYVPRLELLEDRTLPSIFTVLNTNDSGPDSLRQAILDANATANVGGLPDEIDFNIPGAGVQTISPVSALPAITDPVIIDGYTQPGAAPNSLANGDNAVLLIELDGTNVPDSTQGLQILTSDSTLRGLVINRFTAEGIGINASPGGFVLLASAPNNVIEGNFIGTDPTGTIALGNGGSQYGGGVVIGSASNRIGGTAPAARNVVSGNAGDGVHIAAFAPLPTGFQGASQNLIQGNFIGTDATGAAALGNTGSGVHIEQAPGNAIGGTDPGAGNVISANGTGILLSGLPAGQGAPSVVQGNLIGTDVTGTAALGNSEGIELDGCQAVVIGGPVAAARNVISGNQFRGVLIVDEQLDSTVPGNVLQGNLIGTQIDGRTRLGNGTNGVQILGGVNNTIGGAGIEWPSSAGGNGHFYLLTNGSMNWQQAEALAVALGGHLVSINSQAEQDFMVTNFLTGPGSVKTYWIGATDQDVEGTFVWSSGEPITFTNWHPGEPNDFNGIEDYGVINWHYTHQSGPVGDWNDVPLDGLASDLSSAERYAGIIELPFVPASLGNVIADNGGIEDGTGVLVSGGVSTGNAILGNAISHNTQFGIGLGSSFPIANDAGDADTGPNNLQNSPVLISAVSSNVSTTVTGTLNSTPNTTFRIEFFANPNVGDAFIEGEQFIGATQVTTDANGDAAIQATFPVAVPVGVLMSATATDFDNNTSDFSNDYVPVKPATSADVALIATASPNPVVFGHTLTYFLAATNFGPDPATGVTITDTLPAGVALTSAVSSQGTFTQSGNQLTFTLGDLAPRASATVVMTATVAATTTGTLVDTASVTANETDPDTSNNAVEIDTPDLYPGTLQFSSRSYQVNEGSRTAVITVTRTGGSFGTVSVDFATSDGTATSGLFRGDYLKTAGTLTFNDGETSKTIAVPIINDSRIEPNETVNLTLSNVTGGALLGAPAKAALTIIDNDPEISFALATSKQIENVRKPLSIGVTLSGPTTKTLTVDYGVVGGTATPGVDFRFTNGQLVFRPGETSKTITFSLINDSLYEQDETVVIQLSNPVNGSLGAIRTHTFTIVDDESPPDPAGNTQATAQVVDLFRVPRQVLANTLSNSDSDMYRVDLNQGDFLAIDVDPHGVPALMQSSLTITAPDGTNQRIGASPEPDTGLSTQTPAFLLQASQSGAYYLLLQTGGKPAQGYTLELHRIALAQGPQDIATLQQTGPMYAFLNGDTLSFSGPSGYGFAITGNWTQTISHTGKPGTALSFLPVSTYTATGIVTMQTALGPFPLHVPDGKTFTVTTKPNVWGRVFGEVQTVKPNVSLLPDGYTDAFLVALAVLGHPDLALAANQLDWTIQLGSQIIKDHGIEQVVNGVPYLTYSAPLSGHVTFANRDFDIPLGFLTSKPLLALDPTDPMLYLGVPAKNFALAASANGRIPFVPVHTPTDPEAGELLKFYGHVFASYSFGFDAAGVPLSLDADITINLDANGDGQLLAGKGAEAGLLLFSPVAINNPDLFDAVLPDLDIGMNGALKFGLGSLLLNKFHIHHDGDLKDIPVPFDVTLGDATLVFNGQQRGFWIDGKAGVDNPLANTPFAYLTATNQSTFELGIFGDGRFFFNFDAHIPNVFLPGANLVFTLHVDNNAVLAFLDGSVKWTVNNGFSAQADIIGTLAVTFDANTGKLHYVGGVHASGKVKGFGTSVSFDVGADVVDGVLIFDLPIIGRQTIALP